MAYGVIGNTPVFGTGILGSSPGRPTIFLSNLTLYVFGIVIEKREEWLSTYDLPIINKTRFLRVFLLLQHVVLQYFVFMISTMHSERVKISIGHNLRVSKRCFHAEEIYRYLHQAQVKIIWSCLLA